VGPGQIRDAFGVRHALDPEVHRRTAADHGVTAGRVTAGTAEQRRDDLLVAVLLSQRLRQERLQDDPRRHGTNELWTLQPDELFVQRGRQASA
jgi:hypothetical protein